MQVYVLPSAMLYELKKEHWECRLQGQMPRLVMLTKVKNNVDPLGDLDDLLQSWMDSSLANVTPIHQIEWKSAR